MAIVYPIWQTNQGSLKYRPETPVYMKGFKDYQSGLVSGRPGASCAWAKNCEVLTLRAGLWVSVTAISVDSLRSSIQFQKWEPLKNRGSH